MEEEEHFEISTENKDEVKNIVNKEENIVKKDLHKEKELLSSSTNQKKKNNNTATAPSSRKGSKLDFEKATQARQNLGNVTKREVNSKLGVVDQGHFHPPTPRG